MHTGNNSNELATLTSKAAMMRADVECNFYRIPRLLAHEGALRPLAMQSSLKPIVLKAIAAVSGTAVAEHLQSRQCALGRGRMALKRF